MLQEAFVNVWHRAGSYRESASAPMTWLTTIVRNRALDVLRSEGRHGADSLTDDEDGMRDIEDADADPATLLERAGDALAIRACLDAIEGVQRQCLALAYYRGFTHAEVAAHLGSPIGSVKVWLRRGLEKLERCLGRARMNYDRAELLDALAARYVVGTMASRPRRRFERLRSRLPAADAAAIAWERRTAPLATRRAARRAVAARVGRDRPADRRPRGPTRARRGGTGSRVVVAGSSRSRASRSACSRPSA